MPQSSCESDVSCVVAPNTLYRVKPDFCNFCDAARVKMSKQHIPTGAVTPHIAETFVLAVCDSELNYFIISPSFFIVLSLYHLLYH